MLRVPALWTPGFIAFGALELVVPVWAERAAPTTWHPQHIAERYGLFTLIRPEYRQTRLFGPIAAVLVLLSPLTGQAVPLTGAVLASLVAVKLLLRRR